MTIGLWHEDIIGYFQSNLFCGTAHLFEGQYLAVRSNDNVMINLDRKSQQWQLFGLLALDGKILPNSCLASRGSVHLSETSVAWNFYRRAH